MQTRQGRFKGAVLAGAVLGVVCIVGASVRSGFGLGAGYLFAFWYNRLLLGILLGLLPPLPALLPRILRGASLGFLVSFAFFSGAGYGDWIGLFAGPVYGVIIEMAAARFADR